MPRVDFESEFDCAAALWNLLDDVDTALDMCPMPDETRQILSLIVERRFEHAKDELTHDGEDWEQIWLHQ